MNEELKTRIEKVLDEQVRPRLQLDGGDVQLVDVSDDGMVKVRLTGGCQGCPMAGLTMTMMVERSLKAAIPEVKQVDMAEEDRNPNDKAQMSNKIPSPNVK